MVSGGQLQRLRAVVRGAVQGVGFRPFVYRLATSLKLKGWVNNTSQGVFIEVEGPKEKLEEFLLRLEAERPPRASIQSLESSFLDPVGFEGFEIRLSEESGEKTVLVLPDIATCPECLEEIFDPGDRRYLYPFTNCTNCGPRFTIIEALPYDRPNTTMRIFEMCEECRAEYEDPLDRRFHAQPNACPKCGPHLELWDPEGRVLAERHEALLAAAEAIRQGKIVAVKGLGGFHLMVDARSSEAVKRLRERKRREEKPFALMYPTLELIEEHCRLSKLEERLLTSPEAPIVLLRRKSSAGETAEEVAPKNPYLGVMLPYTPLHHILLAELGFPVVATSGNLSDEPICTSEHEALRRLGDIADLFLVHNRPIARHVDDSVVCVVLGRELVLRRARGYAPLPIHLKHDLPQALAVGAHLKNTIAISMGREVFISQYIGDLETAEAFEAFRRVIEDFHRLYEPKPWLVVCDAHPDYLSTRHAERLGLKLRRVQHHLAHVLSCMAENELDGPVLGVSWDGTGYGLDGTVWGGEFLLVSDKGFERIAHFRHFRLPGGEAAIREPRRAAIGLLFELFGKELFEMAELAPISACSSGELATLRRMIARGVNSPLTSSVGRLFDAAASILGLRQRVSFEGQAAMELEFAIDGANTSESYSLPLEGAVVDWEPMIRKLLEDISRKLPVSQISAKFHNALVEAIVAVAKRAGEERVVLSGGCFQNRYLTERAVLRLREEGFRPYWHQRVPPNDGGIAPGQILAASLKGLV